MRIAQLRLSLVLLMVAAVYAAVALQCGEVHDGPQQRSLRSLSSGRPFVPSWKGFHAEDEEAQVRTEWALVSARVAKKMPHLKTSCDSQATHEPDVIQWTRHKDDQKAVRNYLPPGDYHTMVRVTHENGESLVRMSKGFKVTRNSEPASTGSCVNDGICRERMLRSDPNSDFVTNFSGSFDKNTIERALATGVIPQSSAFFNPGEEFADVVDGEDDDDLSGGAIAGITIAVVAAVIIVIIIIILLVVLLSGGQQRFTGQAPSGALEAVDA